MDPLGLVPRHVVEETVRGDLVAGIDLLVEEEPVEERVQLGAERGRPRAVFVSADLLEAVVFWNTEGFPDGVGRAHAAEATQRTEPDEVGVLEGDHGAGRDESGERVVVEGEDLEGVHEVVEVGGEPDVLLHDLRRRLHDRALVLLEERQPPARVATRARLLGDGQRDAGLERASHERALAVTGASCDGNLLRVDPCGGSGLEHVDDATDAPDPGHHRARGGVLTVQVEEETDTSAALVVLLSHTRVVEVHESNLREYDSQPGHITRGDMYAHPVRNGDAASTVPNDQGPPAPWSRPRWECNRRRERDGLPAVRCGDVQNA